MTKMSVDADDLFSGFPHSAAEHFRLHFFGAVLVYLDFEVRCADSVEAVLERHPFLVGYNNELATLLEGVSAEVAFPRWLAALERWEERTTVHLPLRQLRELLGVSATGVMCLLTAELAEEDARFGGAFEPHQTPPGQRRCTLGLLRAIWRTQLAGGDFARLWRQARHFGVAETVNPGAANPELAVQIPAAVWDCLRGDSGVNLVPWARHPPAVDLPRLDELILPVDTISAVRAVPGVLAAGTSSCVVVRGAAHNGRRTLLGAIARAMGRTVLELKTAEPVEEARWREFAALAALTNAFAIVALDLAPGEVRSIPPDWPAGVPLGIALRSTGAIGGEIAANAIELTLVSPDLDARAQHWSRALPALPADERIAISARHRLPAGQIHRAARRACTQARLAGRDDVTGDDVADALRSLNRQTLDTLARRSVVGGDWSRLCASAATLRELEHLESHCRHRERLPALLDPTRTTGVRALFSGPSGTGKTHAARLLASVLQKDLYQLNLAEIVNKYVGETEKNLSRVLEAAEDLDVILLMDEGDALLAQRTDVQSSNDRFGNLQTNFLLQRLERYDGILIITTNARGRIDPAFERRMDVTVEFHAPDAEERGRLWQLHLPARHEVRAEFIEELAARCELTGGQIRNAALHAALLAFDHGAVVRTAYVEAAVRREYARLGGVCPLRHVAEIY